MFNVQISPIKEKEIQTCLDKIEEDHNVRILFAVESGSRAWGFPSEDSDYDVRFIYARPIDWYVSIRERRDVIEIPIDESLDINGWDIKKGLSLLNKHNPGMLEWLVSPHFYRGDQKLIEELRQFARETSPRESMGYHYRQYCKNQLRRYINDRSEIKYKKYFYVIRPALALRWLRENPAESNPLVPMNINELLSSVSVSQEFHSEVLNLISLKKTASEDWRGPSIQILDDFVLQELERAEGDFKPKKVKEEFYTYADDLFRKIIMP